MAVNIIVLRTGIGVILMLIVAFCLVDPVLTVTKSISTIVGTGSADSTGTAGFATAASVNRPRGVWVDSGGFTYFGEASGNCVRGFGSSSIVVNIAGVCQTSGSTGDGGPATSAKMSYPFGISGTTPGYLYITDNSNSKIRAVFSGIISTYAGSSTSGSSGDGGAATAASLSSPCSMALDSVGKMYIALHGDARIRAVDTSGKIYLFSGSGGGGLGDGGKATSATMDDVERVSVDSTGIVYVADTSRVRCISLTGIISTVIGNGGTTYAGENIAATSMGMDTPLGNAVDSSNGNVYIGVQNFQRVLVLTKSTGLMTTFAGGGQTSIIDGGPATAVSFTPDAIFLYVNSDLYITDVDSHRIHRVYTSVPPTTSPTLGPTTLPTKQPTVTPSLTPSLLPSLVPSVSPSLLPTCSPTCIPTNASPTCLPSLLPTGSPSSARSSLNYIQTVVGSSAGGGAGTGGPATAATLSGPRGIWLDSAGTFYFVETDVCYVRKFSTSTFIVSNVAGVYNSGGFSGDGGAATAAQFSSPLGVITSTTGVIYIGDYSNVRVRAISNGIVSTFAGTGTAGSNGNGGAATAALLNGPCRLAVDTASKIYIVNFDGNRIQVVNTANIISLIAGSGSGLGDGGPATNAALYWPIQVHCDSVGLLYFVDSGNNRIRSISTSGILSTVMGSGAAVYGAESVPATACGVPAPAGVTVDSGNGDVYCSSVLRVQVMTKTNSLVTTFAGSSTQSNTGDGGYATAATFIVPDELRISTDSILYISDYVANRIRKIYSVTPTALPTTFTPSVKPTVAPSMAPTVKTFLINAFAGTGGQGTSGDGGKATSALLKGSLGVFTDTIGVTYLLDGSSRMRKVDSSGLISLVSGTAAASNGDGGLISNANLLSPGGIWGDSSGRLFVSEVGGARVRMISAAGIVSTYAGTGTAPTVPTATNGDGGQATAALFFSAYFVFVDSSGILYVSDYSGFKIRKVDSNGIVKTVVGTGVQSVSGDGGAATSAAVSSVYGVVLDSTGNLYIAESTGNLIRRVTAAQIIATVAGTNQGGFNFDYIAPTSTQLNDPRGVWADTAGNVYFADISNKRVRILTSTTVYTVAGLGSGAANNGNGGYATSATVPSPWGLYGDTAGSILYSDSTYVVRSLTLPPVPSVAPTLVPTSAGTLSLLPTILPTVIPSLNPSVNPTVGPTTNPSVLPTVAPSLTPSRSPSVAPTLPPSLAPTACPSCLPSVQPSLLPSLIPSACPTTTAPSIGPSTLPSVAPSLCPSLIPTFTPTRVPTLNPSVLPSVNPSVGPSVVPSLVPSVMPSVSPSTLSPTVIPSLCPTLSPSANPSVVPSLGPTAAPSTFAPSVVPSVIPTTTLPSLLPSTKPSLVPTVTPTAGPTIVPTVAPSSGPTVLPTLTPTLGPSPMPTVYPTVGPSICPSVKPTSPTLIPTPLPTPDNFVSYVPTIDPTQAPSVLPTRSPTMVPTMAPTVLPSLLPTVNPSVLPTRIPTVVPSGGPTMSPTVNPTVVPSVVPTEVPSVKPTLLPSLAPSSYPTLDPTLGPSVLPTVTPTISPSTVPSYLPSLDPSVVPTTIPSVGPTTAPSGAPSTIPSLGPSVVPSCCPSLAPSIVPSVSPSCQPSVIPTAPPSVASTRIPSTVPSRLPTLVPTCKPTTTVTPTAGPSLLPTTEPTSPPTISPILPTVLPSVEPSGVPSYFPTVLPSVGPSLTSSRLPSVQPSFAPTLTPSLCPSAIPSVNPSATPSVAPSEDPSVEPTVMPSLLPSTSPSLSPSANPTLVPSIQPSVQPSPKLSTQSSISPTKCPSLNPSVHPSIIPSCCPSVVPTVVSHSPTVTRYPTAPSVLPTKKPSLSPSVKPSRNPTINPTVKPTHCPSMKPTPTPTVNPTYVPTTSAPVISLCPTQDPATSNFPSFIPSASPSETPSAGPVYITFNPSVSPVTPSLTPSLVPSAQPTSAMPSVMPSTLVYYETHPKATLPSNSSVSVVGDRSLFFKIVVPFVTILGGYSGSAFSDIILSPATSNSAVSYVLMGSSQLASTSPVSIDQLVAYGGGVGVDSCKRSASPLKDVNGDGYDDLIIGDPFNGRCYVLFGNAFGLVNMTSGFTIFGEQDSSLAGWSVSGAGDVNNDTIHDIIIGAPFARGVGAFYVIYGRNSDLFDVLLGNLTSTQGFAVYGTQKSDYLGISVSDAGDVDKDGCDDVIVGAAMTSLYFAGSAVVMYGGSNLRTTTASQLISLGQGFKFYGAAFSYVGYTVSGAGDVNNDGFADVLIGSSPQKSDQMVSAYLIFGSKILSGSSIVLSSGLSSDQGVRIIGGGMTVSTVGDFNHDSFGDVLIGGSFSTSSQPQYGYILYTNVSFLTKITSQPSFGPTVKPNFAPTLAPSRFPSKVPISPTRTPSTCPSLVPSVQPTSPTVQPSPGVSEPSSMPSMSPSQPTFTPSESPSEFPTMLPSQEPSESPTLVPTVEPTELPTVEPSEAPSMLPTVTVTSQPTTTAPSVPQQSRAPFAAPTLLPTLTSAPVMQYQSYFITGENDVVNSTTPVSGVNYIVNSTGHVTINNHGGGFNNKYTIVPHSNSTLTLTFLNQTSDLIDITGFTGVTQIGQLKLSEGSVIVKFPNGQVIHILNLHLADITSANFIFWSPDPSKDAITNKTLQTLSVAAGVLVALGGLLLASCMACRLYRLNLHKKTLTMMVNDTYFIGTLVTDENGRDVEVGHWNSDNENSNSQLSEHTLNSEGEWRRIGGDDEEGDSSEVDQQLSEHTINSDGEWEMRDEQTSNYPQPLNYMQYQLSHEMPPYLDNSVDDGNHSPALSEYSINSEGDFVDRL